MTDKSPLREAQEKFIVHVPLRATGQERRRLSEASGCTLFTDVVAPCDMPPYPRAIVEGFLVNAAETQGASEQSPKSFTIAGEVMPGDETSPAINVGEAIRVATGSIVAQGAVAVVRMWEAQQTGDTFTVTRPFPPNFFIEEQGVDIKQGAVVLSEGSDLGAAELGLLAGLGINEVVVARAPRITLFSSGDEVIPHSESMRPGAIRDGNSIMLSAAVANAGGLPHFAGIMKDNFDEFVRALKQALTDSDMVVISGGTAVGGRDFISDLLREVGELIIDGVPMRSGRPLIMGMAENKPLVCVAGHPPEALRGFNLFGAAAINRLLGRTLPLPEDE